MGYMTAMDLAEGLDLDLALTVHLRSNLFPAVPLYMIDACKEAIFSVLDYEGHKLIDLPEGVSWRGKDTAPAWAVVEGHHLEAFVDQLFEERFDGGEEE